ncbi:MAG: hypothetical protein Q7R22_002235 [Verrucomicrobiota bacterium JB025]|nr:hypothetical protein [Verrucomicrobiota bacterium JB025]
MSIVSQFQSPEVEAQLKRQKKMATLSSMIIAMLVMALMFLILAFVLLPQITKDVPVIVTYESSRPDEEQDEQKKVKHELQKKPTPPAASLARVITSNSASAVAIPTPDLVTDSPTLEFGSNLDFGDSWGDTGAFGGEGGEASFFGQKVKAKRIAFVIDYSASMRGARDQLMRKELTKTLKTLANGMEFSLIFFAGPVWQGGDTVIAEKKTGKGAQNFTVKAKSGGKFEWRSKGGANNYEPVSKSKVQKMEWTVASKASVSRANRVVEETPLVFGTIWDWPLQAALEMDPQPDIIYFMTDGSAGGRSLDIAKDMGRTARRKNIKINCVALMVPKAREGLEELAKRTDGQFTIVLEGGKRKVVR